MNEDLRVGDKVLIISDDWYLGCIAVIEPCKTTTFNGIDGYFVRIGNKWPMFKYSRNIIKATEMAQILFG